MKPRTIAGRRPVSAAFIVLIFMIAIALFSFRTLSGAWRPGAARDTEGELNSGGRDRTYMLHVPASYRASKPTPLLIALHGGGGNAGHMRRISGLDALSDAKGFIAVFPNGTGVSSRALLTWNAGRCCAYAMDNNVDDIGFLRDLIAALRKQYSVDPKRIYVTGFSNGGMLAHRVACEMPDVVAAVAPVSGSLEADPCEPNAPVSVIIFHGTADNNVPYDGGVGKKALVRLSKKPVSYAVSFWAGRDGCKAAPEKKDYADYIYEKRGGCASGTEVALYTIKGGGHAWPGGTRVLMAEDAPSSSVNASKIIWDFFAAHPKK
jgi:polyhydroxybutyrate depolymerase